MADAPPRPGILERVGRLLFRLRSFTPIPVILVGLVLSWRAQIGPGLGGPAVDAALNVVGPLLCLLGSAIRFVTVGFAPRGDSQTRVVNTARLIVDGPYAIARHPLYLGNACITLGLLCIVDQLPAWLLVGAFFTCAYALIIHAEEAHLRARFGEAWARWASEVPSFVPRLGAWSALRALPFDWKTALQRELTPLVSWGTGALLLLGWEWWAKGQLSDALARRLELGLLALLLVLLANKLSKRRTRAASLERPNP